MISRMNMIAVAALAGFAAGAFAPRLLQVGPVHAQAMPELVQAKSFVLLDGSGRKRGEWKLDASGDPVLQLFDQGGRTIWEAGKPKVRALSR
ncbi:MAG: hypothetical protein ACR2NN_18940 [Bryobacteraceae bacterium]